MGLVSIALPLGTLRHCQSVTVQIDADRTYQYGGNVFYNDTKQLVAVDRAAIRICPVPPIIRGIEQDDEDYSETL